WRMEVVYMPPDYDRAGGFEFAELLIARHPSAIVWLMPQASDMLLVRYLVSSGVSVVTYNRDFTQTGAIGVVADVSDVAGKLFDAVYDQGARRIACLSIDKVSPSIRQFVDVVVHRATERGMDPPPQTMYLPYSEAKFLTDEVHQRVDELMSRPDRPDGIVCAESYSLLALEWWLSEHPEVRVPKDLAVASFDRQLAESVVRVMPPIPRGDFDQRGMMEAAIQLVEMQLAGRRIEHPLRVVPAVLLPPSPERRRMPNGSAQPGVAARS
ncbi:MAG TPA: substrate-binding domain-containing protein, partial [Tepidisphaeraceae bacterium]|nr:substrate-binding domain-containing protein [Tepidisphaeraceae bacterium]